ncbi:MAG: hypothetical protein WBP93_03680 [Pyrinomonadaceae bacterium]
MDIQDYRREFAAYNSALILAHYNFRAGLVPLLEIEPVYERYGDLFTRAAIDELERAARETPASRETESRGLHALCGAARLGYMEAEARDLTNERARCEASLRIEWEGESVPVHAAPKMIANEADAARRRELTARWTDALTVCDDLRAARLESFHESARSLGFDSYRALYNRITGIDYERLKASTDAFLSRTEAAYTSALAKAATRDLPGVAFENLDQADYFFFQRMSRLDEFFPASDLMKVYASAMAGLGIRVEQQRNILIDAEERPLKNPRAACMAVNPPDDVRLLVAPIGGVSDYTTLFHEAGHAQHFAWTSRELFKRHPEFVYAPDYATTESYAFLFNHLFNDEAWLAEHRSNINSVHAREIVRDLSILKAYTVRRFCAKLSYDIALHDSSQVRSEQLANTYAALQTEATLFRRGPALYLWDLDDGFYSAAYLRAWAFEAGLQEHLRTRYGRRWWASRKAGDELIDLWNTASRYTVEELARLTGFGEISFDLLADNLIDAMIGD